MHVENQSLNLTFLNKIVPFIFESIIAYMSKISISKVLYRTLYTELYLQNQNVFTNLYL